MTTMASKVPFISTDGIPGTQAGAGSCKTIAIGVLTIIDRNATSSKKNIWGRNHHL